MKDSQYNYTIFIYIYIAHYNKIIIIMKDNKYYYTIFI